MGRLATPLSLCRLLSLFLEPVLAHMSNGPSLYSLFPLYSSAHLHIVLSCPFYPFFFVLPACLS